MTLYRRRAELDFELADLPRLPRPDRVLMADPAHYDTQYAINPHMLDERGELKRVDRAKARREWTALRQGFERHGLRVDVLAPLAGQPDLVFCANQVLPIPGAAMRDGRARIVPSHMAHAERRDEVPHVVNELARQGYLVEPLRTEAPIEGMGDGLWHPGRRLLWAGVGPRSSEAAWREVAERYELPVVLLELADRDFYHLDTCLALLAEDACLWLPSALEPDSRELVEALIPRRIEADEREARELFACNAFCADSLRVFLQRGVVRTRERLSAAGFDAIEVATDEFLKAGGSVFCMKLLHGPLG
jgi:N-dimethylarginine dimethylaminohydrolase